MLDRLELMPAALPDNPALPWMVEGARQDQDHQMGSGRRHFVMRDPVHCCSRHNWQLLQSSQRIRACILQQEFQAVSATLGLFRSIDEPAS